MIAEIAITLTIFVFWVCGTAATYRVCKSEDGPLVDFAGSLIFWWLILPFYVCGAGWKAGAHGYELFLERRERQRRPLRAGADNGLYESEEVS